MTPIRPPIRIGAALPHRRIRDHRDWLFDGARDIEIQDLLSFEALSDWRPIADAVNAALDGHTGRRGIHGPFEGLDMDNKDPEVRPIITNRFLSALEAADAIGARQMVLHSPYRAWYERNRLAKPDYAAGKLSRIHDILGPVVDRAAALGIVLVIENIEDVDPATRRMMVDSFVSDAIALSVDTGHAHLARAMSGAPPVDYFIRDAGPQLAHVHVQDVDGHADRHWAIGRGDLNWAPIFETIAAVIADQDDQDAAPHVVLELSDPDGIPESFAYLRDRGLVE